MAKKNKTTNPTSPPKKNFFVQIWAHNPKRVQIQFCHFWPHVGENFVFSAPTQTNFEKSPLVKIYQSKSAQLSGPIRANRFSLRKNLLFANRPSKNGIAARIGRESREFQCESERRRDSREIWPNASKIGIFLRVDSRESAKHWCANRLPH